MKAILTKPISLATAALLLAAGCGGGGGGNEPVWGPDNTVLYYRKLGGSEDLVVASIQTEPQLRVTGSEAGWGGADFWSRILRAHFDGDPDGQRFLVLNQRSTEEEQQKMIVVLNWFEELKQRVPTGGR